MESDMIDIQEKIVQLDEQSEDQKMSLSKKFIVIKSTQDFHRRVLRAYEFNRMQKVQKSIIDYDDLTEIKKKLTLTEKKHLEFMKNLFKEYQDNENITFENHAPSKSFYVHFITLTDCGIVVDGDEIFELKPHKYFYMKRALVNHLINTKHIKLFE
ncbi:hypothetical protein M153_298330002 [Pseudoloma neurophilia]|uniref:DNA replication complex GINS protein PSF1 n=1 Tax=Pseudoloma neurophilia TaxID=146866 RepID=A0A0R0LWB1_9MICR|nr:hypothetical protein M153_298330002 [Pseudoloma neurophilia]